MPNKRPDAERRLRQSFRFGRLIKLLMQLQQERPRKIGDLARTLECSERTVFRDLQVLELAGVPWLFDRSFQGYQLQSGWRFPALQLTPDEVVGQALATVITNSPGFRVGTGAKATSEKLAGTLSPESKKLLADAGQLMAVLSLESAEEGRVGGILRTLQWALLQRKQVAGLYVSPYESKPKRIRLQPYRLCMIRQVWYVIGRSSNDVRPKTYRVGRFKSLRTLDQSAAVPESFSLQEYLGNAWSVFRGDTSYDVEVHFAKAAAAQVTETRWHATQTSRWHRDGSVTLSFCIDGLDEIVWWLLGWAGFAKVIRPEQLRVAVLAQLRAGVDMNRVSLK